MKGTGDRMNWSGFKIIAGMLLAFILLHGVTLAVAPSEEVIARLKESGQLDSYMQRLRQMREAGADTPDKLLLGQRLAANSQAIDTHQVVVLLIDFSDMPYTVGNAAPTADEFDSLLFSDSLKNPTGSMKEFYYENSYGQYVIEGDVYGWYSSTLGHDDFTSIFNAATLVGMAVNAADNDVDFSKYDNDDDGFVEGVIVIHAGTGAEESGDLTDIHSHCANLGQSILVDGVRVFRYTIQPEESYVTGSIIQIGVFCHEWGHILGLPDLYDIDEGDDNEGVGRWSLMGSGNYNNLSKSPSHFDAWSKYQLGWLDPIRVMQNTSNVDIPAIEFNPVAYLLARDGSGTSEYFLIENRQKLGFDVGLMGAGIIIYHVDESRTSNRSDWHPLIFVEQADGNYDLQYGRNRGDFNDPWPYKDKIDFHDKTDPGSKYYSFVSSQVALWNMSASDSIMYADIDVTFSRPWLTATSVIFSDLAYGNQNDIIEAGETIQVLLALQNDWGDAENVVATLSADDPLLTIKEETAEYGLIATGTSAVNAPPFEFTVPSEYASRIDSFYFEVSSNGGSYTISFADEASVGKPQILIVDADDQNADSLEKVITDFMYNSRKPVRVWDRTAQGTPLPSTTFDYSMMIWQTGDYREDLLSTEDIATMKVYMDQNDGNVFLTGEGLAKQLSTQDPDFLNNYLGAEYIDVQYAGSSLLNPSEGPISSGLKWMFINSQLVVDHISPIGGGVGEWEYYNMTGEYGGVSNISGNYKSVFFAFKMESVRNTDTLFTPARVMLDRIMEFFGAIPTDVENPGEMAVNLPQRFKLNQNYPNPFNPITKINYLVTGAGTRFDRTRIDVFNIIGQHVLTLVDRYEMPGEYQVTWDGCGQNGESVASGIYYYRLTRGDQSETKKMVFLK
ncbi:MAG: M6 family metalloprotease domain-containing protein [Candidatus Zixiibacteriota bacterium]